MTKAKKDENLKIDPKTDPKTDPETTRSSELDIKSDESKPKDEIKDDRTKTKKNVRSEAKSDKKKTKRKSKYRERTRKEERERRRLRRMVQNESLRITKVIIPIVVCMSIVVFSIFLFPIYTKGFGEQAKELGMGSFYEQKDAGTGSKISSALIMTGILLVFLIVITFCMAMVIIYEWQRFIKCFFIFAFIIYFGLLGSIYVCIALNHFNIAIDWITVLIVMWNYTGLGLTIFFINGPKVLKQMYLILLSSNVALVLILILGDLTAWVLLIALALWDCYAVLHRSGPLNQIFEATQGKELPPILYTTAVWLQTSETDDSSDLEIGLGDFVFYSILVGKSFSNGHFLTAIICFISILVGLAITLFILLMKNTPLPALPISIALGVIMNFITEFCIIPFSDILALKQIFI